MKEGFYIVKIDDDGITVGYFEGLFDECGSKNDYPWQIVGSDEIIKNKEITVIRKIDVGE